MREMTSMDARVGEIEYQIGVYGAEQRRLVDLSRAQEQHTAAALEAWRQDRSNTIDSISARAHDRWRNERSTT